MILTVTEAAPARSAITEAHRTIGERARSARADEPNLFTHLFKHALGCDAIRIDQPDVAAHGRGTPSAG